MKNSAVKNFPKDNHFNPVTAGCNDRGSVYTSKCCNAAGKI